MINVNVHAYIPACNFKVEHAADGQIWVIFPRSELSLLMPPEDGRVLGHMLLAATSPVGPAQSVNGALAGNAGYVNQDPVPVPAAAAAAEG